MAAMAALDARVRSLTVSAFHASPWSWTGVAQAPLFVDGPTAAVQGNELPLHLRRSLVPLPLPYAAPMSEISPFRPLPFHAWGAGFQRPLLIGGPCSAESADQVMHVARDLAADGRATILRAGIWKPRTRPGHFEGTGEAALEWMREASQATGLRSMVEVATPAHVEAALRAGMDVLWIGARTTPNPFSVQEIADALRGVDVPVFVKNPINPDLGL